MALVFLPQNQLKELCYSMEASNCQKNVMIAYKTYDISDDNNYALEEYGEGSMCFEQGGPWQQKSCTMLKQWQRYGAGTVRVTVRHCGEKCLIFRHI